MPPDKSWMQSDDRLDSDYRTGIEEFLEYAFTRIGDSGVIWCPCVKCTNAEMHSREVVGEHLLVHGIIKSYTYWCHHGEGGYGSDEEDDGVFEDSDSEDQLPDLLRDMHPPEVEVENQSTSYENPNIDAENFARLMKEAEELIYPGCKLTKLHALVKLLHIKVLGGWSNESFTMLVELLGEILPEGSRLPKSYYEAKKFIRDLGLSYNKVDACINDCMLYWKQDKDESSCKVCGVSRWVENKHSGETMTRKNGKKIPKKIMRHFPLKPRLQRLFMCSKTASLMSWHHDKRCKDEKMRHPADSLAWKTFDETYMDFASEPRNVRMGLSTDGFQPFGKMSAAHSIWPIFLIPYNLPPWLCMKQPNFILSTLISGPEGPGDRIDVYMQPLIEELKELWNFGIEVYDASTSSTFRLHAAVLWTISDFPALANLSGWSTKGNLACPRCHSYTHSMRLNNGCKQCYMGHRQFLPLDHPWRLDKMNFDGTEEWGLPPDPLSGDDVLNQVSDLEGIPLTKDRARKVKISHKARGDNWTKKSIFFELPYWKSLLLRHNLDVMHIEKNVCDNILGTLMNIKGKTKDNLKSRLDLQEMGLRPNLHPRVEGGKTILPDAPFTLTLQKKRTFCQFLKDVKVPDGFSSNISRCVNLMESNISGLKSHDCHILLHHLIPIAIRGLLPKDVCEPLIELSIFFRGLSATTLCIDELDRLETQVSITLCKLEKVFPPSFFDVMVHLIIHLASEAKIGGPVQFRSMYSVERDLRTLKSYVRNKAKPEGSIAEGYIADECMTLCSRYLHGVETKFNRPERNNDGGLIPSNGGLSIFYHPGKALGAANVRNLSYAERLQCHIYILNNTYEVKPYFEEHWHIYGHLPMSEMEKNEHFINWFRDMVATRFKRGDQFADDFLSLSRGPSASVICRTGYVTNGFKFHTKSHDLHLKTQNSSVSVMGDIGVGVENIEYYGVITEILELQYLNAKRVVLFGCNWWDVHSPRGVKQDEYGYTSVNCKKRLKTNEPFVLASQALQVFNVKDISNKGWEVVLKVHPRNIYDMPLQIEESDEFV